MARLLPPYIDKGCKSTGEKMIFDILKNSSFTNNWTIFHSLNLSQHAVRLYGEIDFLLLIPNGGIFVMEVKSGNIKCADGIWYIIDRYGNKHKGRSPFNQARDAMFSLHSAIEKEFGRGHKFTKIPFGFCCAFPHIPFDKHSVEYEPWQILDKDTIHTGVDIFFQNLVNQFIIKYSERKWFSEVDSLPSSDDLNLLSNFLRGDFERIRSAKESLAEFDKQVKAYTSEQFRILDSIKLNERSVIQGCAGTGKTMIAIESAIRAASEGKSVFLSCFNRLIGEWMQKQVVEWGPKITASNLHSYMFEASKGFNYDQSRNSKNDFYSKYLPTLLRDIFQKGINNKFDKLIIDEGQDLIRDEYLKLFDAMLVGGLSNGNWEIYGDFERQAIYSQLTKIEMYDMLKNMGQHANFLLNINCRNTKQIGEETALVSGFKKSPYLLEHLDGIPVEYIYFSDDSHQKSLIHEQLNKLSQNKIPFNEILILSPRKFENSCSYSIEGYSIKEIKHVSEVSAIQRYIGFSTIQSYKGMECNYIMIVDIDDLTSDIAKSLLYVGMSRARYGLILFITEKVKLQYKEILKNKLN